MEIPIYKCFKTYNGYYCYDRSTGSIICLSQTEFEELKKVIAGELSATESHSINKFRENGFFKKNLVEKIEHYATFDLEHIVKNQMNQLILQVTQQCNLRCHYCAYSGNYYNREHSAQRMSQNTAIRAVDFFMKHSIESKYVTVGFYGGEPLLEIELIKNVIAYCKEKYSYREMKFNLTINGTLLYEELVRYFAKNKVTITISLDGSKEEHDANRVSADGKGTFDKIIKNVQMIENIDNDYYKNHVLFNTVINPKVKLGCIDEYFSTTELFQDAQILFSNVATQNLKDERLTRYNAEFWIPRNYEYLKKLLFLSGNISEKSLSVLVKNSIGDTDDFARLLDNRKPQKKEHHNGPCVPAVQRLFVTVDEKLYPCERVSEQCSCFCIGTLDEGLDIQKISLILNCGKLSENECKKCWNLLLCSMCLGEVEGKNNNEFTRQDKLAQCNQSKYRSQENLKEYCTLKEFGYRRTYTKEEQRV